jgi:hypothetical protein
MLTPVKSFVAVGRFGPVSRPPSHPISCPSWLDLAHHNGRVPGRFEMWHGAC